MSLYRQQEDTSKEYEVLCKIGEGKYAEVYKVRRIADGFVCSMKRVKVFEMGADDRKKCTNEVEILKSLRHPNIIQYFEHFFSNNELHIIMEYAEGGDLKHMIDEFNKSRRTFSELDIWRQVYSIASGLAYMHSHKIMHRDIKPSNVYLTSGGYIKLGDLGLGRVLSAVSTHAASVVGTPYYMSPEVIMQKSYEFRSDLWSLGCLIYELAMLASPFEINSSQSFYVLGQNIINCVYPPMSTNYSSALRQLVASLIQQDPRGRAPAIDIVRIARAVIEKLQQNQPLPSGAVPELSDHFPFFDALSIE